MLFNSYLFIFVFLPVTFLVYFMLSNKISAKSSQIFLILASLFFYAYWNIKYLPLILISMGINYYLGRYLAKRTSSKPKIVLGLGVIFNLSLLGYFKYSDFFIENFNRLVHSEINLLHLTLPLAISFYTFQQIAYLVDSYRHETKEYSFINYALFVTFFPQLIAGPIVHHSEMMPQFAKSENKKVNYYNIALGLFIFFMGLFKKVIIADTFAAWATKGFDMAHSLNMLEAWATSLSYTFQLYFDFSGYTDMAIGAALLFNIKLPMNFFSPYKATSIQDFWRRWHITLSRFLKDYIYIPLGGNRKGEIRTYINLFTTFVLGGIWHGAGWTFVFWGILHGTALVIHRLWQKIGFRLPVLLGWFLTFNFINIAWVFFRATNFESALKVLKGMFFGQLILPKELMTYIGSLKNWGIDVGVWSKLYKEETYMHVWLIVTFIVVMFLPNSMQWKEKFKTNIFYIFLTLFFFLSVFMLYRKSEFIYFNF